MLDDAGLVDQVVPRLRWDVAAPGSMVAQEDSVAAFSGKQMEAGGSQQDTRHGHTVMVTSFAQSPVLDTGKHDGTDL